MNKDYFLRFNSSRRPGLGCRIFIGLWLLAMTLLMVEKCAGAPAWPVPTNILIHTEQHWIVARNHYFNEPTNSMAAWQLGQACFAWGDLQTNRAQREILFTEGVTACRRSLALNSNAAPAFYYLGMNLGKIADLKRNLAALGMVREVERCFAQARVLDETFSHAGPDRNLGLLYWEAPGWPLSVGNKKLARKHLERAVDLAGAHPENRLNLAEAGVAWKDWALVTNQWAALEQIWPAARTNLTGPDWEWDWLNWESRRAALQRQMTSK